MTVNLNLIKAAFEEEQARKSAYEAQMRANWKSGEGHDLALVTARHIKVAMEGGAKKIDILRALNRKGYKLVDDYVALLSAQPATNNTEDSVRVEGHLEGEDVLVTVLLKNYQIGGDVFTGSVEFRGDEDGDWYYADDTDLAVAVDNELFFSNNENQTILQRKWGEVVQ